MKYWAIVVVGICATSFCNVHSYLTSSSSTTYRASLCNGILNALPRDIVFDAGQVEIVRMIGKIDIQINEQILEDAKGDFEKSGGDDEKKMNEFNQWSSAAAKTGMATSVRVFEARIPGGTKCFLKEFLPIGLAFGKRELQTTRKLVARWTDLETSTPDSIPPFPVLLGSLKTDERVEDPAFRNRWLMMFPKTRPPGAGNLWLIFKWDKSSFKSLKTFPPLPQVVEGLDYFQKEKRLMKRWRFIRKIMRSGLETVDFIHRSGYCHNAVSSESLWMSTTNQQSMDELGLSITDLGACQKFSELGPQVAREGTIIDMYQLGFVFLELVFASFSEDNVGAEIARGTLGTILFLIITIICIVIYFLIFIFIFILVFIVILMVILIMTFINDIYCYICYKPPLYIYLSICQLITFLIHHL